MRYCANRMLRDIYLLRWAAGQPERTRAAAAARMLFDGPREALH